MTENYTQNDGTTVYKLTGMSVDILKLVCEKMNLTALFLKPSLKLELNSIVKHITQLEDNLSDVLAGLVPLIPVIVTSSFDATIPYMHMNVKMLVPCPKAIAGPEKVLTTFSLSVWLTKGFVLLLITAVFWCAFNVPYQSVCNNAHTYQSLSQCFHNAWAVFVGVSVPQRPTSSTLRDFFFIYVCFCFAISILFQVFLLSFLVEPNYENKFERLDQLLNSHVVYDYHHLHCCYLQDIISYPEIVKFLEDKKLKEDRSDIRKCVEKNITNRCIASFIDPTFDTYVAREMGTVDVGKLICPLDDILLSAGLTIIFKKGNPFLYGFNILMRPYLEAGLLERLWSELQHRVSLRCGGRFREATGVWLSLSPFHI